jgi:DNA-binding transcriptional ArsR family regulator
LATKKLNVLGLPLQLEDLDVKDKIPLVFMEDYDFYKGKILDNKFLVFHFKGDYLSIPRLRKHLEIIPRFLGVTDHCVLWLDKVSSARREGLIENSIPFFVDEKMVFLPFLGTQLEKRHDAALKPLATKFTTAAQCIFLWILYSKTPECPISQIINDLKLSQATVARALLLLMQYGLLTFKGKGTRKKYFRIEAKQFWESGKKYMRTPILKRLFMEDFTPLHSAETYTAGEDALAEMSLLEVPEHQCKAVYKKYFDKFKRSAVASPDMLRSENYLIVELWNYDPGLFAKTCPDSPTKSGIVDIFSLYASLENLIEDVRIEKEFETLMEDFFNG